MVMMMMIMIKTRTTTTAASSNPVSRKNAILQAQLRSHHSTHLQYPSPGVQTFHGYLSQLFNLSKFYIAAKHTNSTVPINNHFTGSPVLDVHL